MIRWTKVVQMCFFFCKFSDTNQGYGRELAIHRAKQRNSFHGIGIGIEIGIENEKNSVQVRFVNQIWGISDRIRYISWMKFLAPYDFENKLPNRIWTEFEINDELVTQFPKIVLFERSSILSAVVFGADKLSKQ